MHWTCSPLKSFLAASLLVVLLGAAGVTLAQDPAESGGFAAALEQAKAQKTLLVIDFYTDW